MPPEELRHIRGDKIAMIFQDPLTALNPVQQVGNQISEVFEVHRGMSRQAGVREAVELLGLVGIPKPEQRVKQYPHEFSGGMRQRAMIAMALALGPDLLIADEPTTALDVTVQAQILDLIDGLKAEFNTAVVMITHDLGVVAEHCREHHGDVRGPAGRVRRSLQTSTTPLNIPIRGDFCNPSAGSILAAKNAFTRSRGSLRR